MAKKATDEEKTAGRGDQPVAQDEDATPDPIRLTVSLKPGHPTGIYHRCGLEITKTAPLELTEAQMQDMLSDDLARLQADPWLIVTGAQENES